MCHWCICSIFTCNSTGIFSGIKADFLADPMNRPLIIGVTGSVAVGKSTTARVLQNLLKRAYPTKAVELMTTDGFLYPNRILRERNIMGSQRISESYDMENLVQFLLDVKTGKPNVRFPVYSHRIYDIVAGEYEVNHPDILIVEGINVLQLPSNQQIYVSDFFDFSIYVDAEEEMIEKWYIERFEMLMDLAIDQPDNYYYNYAIGKRGRRNRDGQRRRKKSQPQESSGVSIYPTITRANLVIHKTTNRY